MPQPLHPNAMSSQRTATPREVAIDLFRGWALAVIFINHIPNNDWMWYTPSRFGFSDASEIFVFLSGYVAAISYGRCFNRNGLNLTTLAVVYRCIQLYCCHLGLFLVLASVCALANGLFSAPDYIEKLNLHYFFNQTPEALLYLVTLRYLPNFFDILPLYMMVLLWIPVFLLVAHYQRGVALLLPVGLYLAMWSFDLHLSADPHSGRSWFFNPFAWQLLFFTGFALAIGWIRITYSNRLLISCALLVVLALPLSHEPTYLNIPLLRDARSLLEPFLNKTNSGPLRWLHFYALAILMRTLVQRMPSLLTFRISKALIQMGQQTLPTFIVGMLLSYLGGIFLDQYGHSIPLLALINFGGISILITSAYALTWLDSKPWKQQRTVPAMAMPPSLNPASALPLINQPPRLQAWSLLLLSVSILPWLLMPKKVHTPLALPTLSSNTLENSDFTTNFSPLLFLEQNNSRPSFDLNLSISNAFLETSIISGTETQLF